MKKVQLLLNLDESAGVISLFAAADAAAQATATKLSDIELPELQKLSPDVAEAMIGAAVLGALDRLSNSGLGVRDYGKEIKEAERRFTDLMKQGADQKDPKAQFHLALSYIAESVELKDLQRLELAEQLLTQSAAAGYSEARSFLTGWPETKARRQKMIEQSR